MPFAEKGREMPPSGAVRGMPFAEKGREMPQAAQ